MTSVSHPPLIVAVSGGVDSVSLLHMLVQAGDPLIVAHVNHGIRDDSDVDESFVRDLASTYSVPFFSTRLRLGLGAGEDMARQARYAWLEKVAKEQGARVIATAHHQDDVLETILINLTRGTGWRGLCSLRSTTLRHRPLLSKSKAEVVGYAIEHKLTWREDSTNESFRYLRNRLRHQAVPKLTAQQRKRLVSLYDSQCNLRSQIYTEIHKLAGAVINDSAIYRYPVIMTDPKVANELLTSWLGEPLESSRMSDLLLFSKVAKTGDRWSLDASRYVLADKTRLIVLTPRD